MNMLPCPKPSCLLFDYPLAEINRLARSAGVIYDFLYE